MKSMMTKEEFFAKVKGGLIASCQALEDEPLYDADFSLMPYMAKACEMAGAVAIRANSVRDILAIKEKVNLPIIGIIKKEYEDSEVYITPTIDEVDCLVDIGCEVIAIDATKRLRPGGVCLKEFLEKVRKKYPDIIIMGDISTLKEAMDAISFGCDFVGTTLSGYTSYSEKSNSVNLKLIGEIVNEGIDVVAEGKINTPYDLKAVYAYDIKSAVVGSAITRPFEIAKRFVEVLKG